MAKNEIKNGADIIPENTKTVERHVDYPKSLLGIIENVAIGAKESQLNDQFFIDHESNLKSLADSYDITPLQAALFAVCMENGAMKINFETMASYLHLSTIRMLGYGTDIDALVRRRLLNYCNVKEEDTIEIPSAVIKSLKRNEVYQMPKRAGLDASGMMEYMCMWFNDLEKEKVSVAEVREELDALIEENQQVAFAQKIKALGLNTTGQTELLFFCHSLLNCDDDEVHVSQFEDLCDNAVHASCTKRALRSGRHYLMRMKLIEHHCVNGIADNTSFCLTQQAKLDLLSEFKLNFADENLANVINPDNLTAKELYFNNNVGRLVDELTSLLDPEKYNEIRTRMQQRGFRQGFTCLFHGGPGTGKTETVFQLARRTGRQVMVVDVPQIKSKWVGESEKNIKALFDRYRTLVQRCDKAPVLLFNEADAIIGIRKQGAQNAVDKMENTIQNIILQEMESLDGILIATTNLTENLDSAFERRFLYKIRFEKPDVQVRSKIMHQMIPELPQRVADNFAARYEFSGGQIENIARKYTVNCILHGDAADLQSALEELCANECLEQQEGVKKIGFLR